MKKKIAFLLTAILACSAVPVYAGVPATPNASKVLVNGESKAFEAYTIDGSNYFKLRDIAYVLNGTEADFAVGWDSYDNCISLDTYSPYTATGTEMQVSGTKDIKDAVESTSTILIDGYRATMKAYTINGSNYFKLRDLGTYLGFNVGWDNAAKTITIDTGNKVASEVPAEPGTLTEEQLTAMGLYSNVVRASEYSGGMDVVLGVPKTSDIVDFKIDKFYIDGVENIAIAVKLPPVEEFTEENSYLWDDTLTEYSIFYRFNNTDVQTDSAYPYTMIQSITLKDGKTYSFTETGILYSGGHGGPGAPGFHLLTPEQQKLFQ